MKKYQVIGLVAGISLGLLGLSGWAVGTLIANSKSTWYPITTSKMMQSIINRHLKIGAQLSYQQAIDAGSFQQLSERYTVIRFQSPMTCGTWGCLHIVSDQQWQQTKAFHLDIPTSSKKENYLAIGDKGCVVATQTKQKIVEQYPLCLAPIL